MSNSLAQQGGQLDMRGRRLLIVGLAREGMALARYLSRQGAHVVATDRKAPHAFGDLLEPLSKAGVEFVLGHHPPALLDDCELVFVSPGVPFDAPLLNEARARGLPLSTESRLFCQLCPAPVAAITGSSGKTTTTTLVGEILKADSQYLGDTYTTWVGGNIGQPLVERIGQVEPSDRLVMELSSFQLEYFHPSANDHVSDCDPMWLSLLSGWSPAVGAILNITPNHLDRHPSMEAYIHAKRALVAYRRPQDVAILNLDDDITRAMGLALPGPVRWFSIQTSRPLVDGARLANRDQTTKILLLNPGRGYERVVCDVSEVQLHGAHNLSNILAACLITDTLGASVEAMRQVLTTFTGVEHRLELVGEFRGVRYYNDSIATSPERVAAALKSFDEPIVLLAGGRDKNLPWDDAARLMLHRTRHIVLFGEAVELIAGALEAASQRLVAEGQNTRGETKPMLHRCVRLEDAVVVASQVARPGQVVLLSPGCTSFDSFKDFAERGDRFRQLVEGLKSGALVN